MATNAFQVGFNRKQNDDDSQSGSASAFQSGFAAGQNKNQNRKAKSTLKSAQQKPTGLQTTQTPLAGMIPMAKKGGRVTKGGLVHVHRGEHIIPAKRSKGKASHKRTTIKP